MQGNYLQRGLNIYKALEQVDQDRIARRADEMEQQALGMAGQGLDVDAMIGQGIDPQIAWKVGHTAMSMREQQGQWQEAAEKRQAEQAFAEAMQVQRDQGVENPLQALESLVKPSGISALNWAQTLSEHIRRMQQDAANHHFLREHDQVRFRQEADAILAAVEYAAVSGNDSRMRELINNSSNPYRIEKTPDGHGYQVYYQDPIGGVENELAFGGRVFSLDQIRAELPKFMTFEQFQPGYIEWRETNSKSIMNPQIGFNRNGQAIKIAPIIAPNRDVHYVVFDGEQERTFTSLGELQKAGFRTKDLVRAEREEEHWRALQEMNKVEKLQIPDMDSRQVKSFIDTVVPFMERYEFHLSEDGLPTEETIEHARNIMQTHPDQEVRKRAGEVYEVASAWVGQVRRNMGAGRDIERTPAYMKGVAQKLVNQGGTYEDLREIQRRVRNDSNPGLAAAVEEVIAANFPESVVSPASEPIALPAPEPIALPAPEPVAPELTVLPEGGDMQEKYKNIFTPLVVHGAREVSEHLVNLAYLAAIDKSEHLAREIPPELWDRLSLREKNELAKKYDFFITVNPVRNVQRRARQAFERNTGLPYWEEGNRVQ